jgi:DNA-directed RNA polymerase specialized sigma subunit
LARPLTREFVAPYVALHGESLRDDLQQAADLGTYLAAESFPQPGPESAPLTSGEWVHHLKGHILNEMRSVVAADLNIPRAAVDSLHYLLKLLNPVERDSASTPSEPELARIFPDRSAKKFRQGLAALAQGRRISLGAAQRQGDSGDERVPDFTPAVVHRALLAELGLSDPAAYAGSPEERKRLLAVVAYDMSASEAGKAVGASESAVSQSARLGLARVRGEVERSELNDALRQHDWDADHPPIVDGSHPPTRRRSPGVTTRRRPPRR